MNPSRSPARLPLVILGLIVAGGFLASGWVQSGGHLMAPLDDTFIHLQYAHRLAEGHFFSYSPGLGYSSGATSWLWVFLLAPLFVFGIAGVKSLGLSILLGGILFILSGLFLHRLANALTGSAIALLLGLLFFLNGHVAWACLSGMETALFTALILFALAAWRAWTEEESRGGRRAFVVALALLPLARPEGWVLWAAATLLVILRGALFPVARRQAIPVVLAAVPGLVAFVLHRVLSGDWTTTGMILKGLWDQPNLSVSDKSLCFTEALWNTFVRFYNNIQPDPLQAQWRGQWVRPYVPPVAVWLALLGGGMGLIGEWRRGRLGAVSLAMVWWVAGMATVACALYPFAHNQRYLVPWTPLMLLLAGVGLARLARLFDPQDRGFVWGIGSVWVLLSVAGAVWWAVEYGRDASDIFHQHRRMSWMVHDTVAPDERVALTDAGAIAYYSDRPVFDLVGLCSSAEQARAFREGEGSVFERMEALTPGERPDWIVTYPAWWTSEFPLGSPRAVASLASTVITSGPDLTLYRFDPAPLASGRFPSRYLGDRGLYLPDDKPPADTQDVLDARLQSQLWEIADEVDVADLESESAHEYRAERPAGQRAGNPNAWPRLWNRVRALRADLPPAAPAATDYPQLRRTLWSVYRDLPMQEYLFAYYTEHGANWTPPAGGASVGTPGSADLAAAALALKRLDSLSTPTLGDLIHLLPPRPPEAHILHDGARGIGRLEEFTLRGVPDAPLLLLWRTDSDSTLTLHLKVDGQPQPPWTIGAAAPGGWSETWVSLPPRTAGRDTIRIRAEFDPPGLPGSAPLSAHWWALTPARK